LQSFVSRFSANASEIKRASSRAKQIDKIQLARSNFTSSRVSHLFVLNKTRSCTARP
jgi:ATPase subunit of ABC transporter with duplicated ATPase domains